MLKSTLISSMIGVLVFFSVSAHHSPDSVINNKEKNFVVIGAFSFYNNAVRFTEHVHNININAQYALNKERNLYYVYSLVSEDKEEAVNSVLKLRQNESFKDAWLFHGLLSEEQGNKILLTQNSYKEEDLYAINTSNKEGIEKQVDSKSKNNSIKNIPGGGDTTAGSESTSPLSNETNDNSDVGHNNSQITASNEDVNGDLPAIAAPIITEDYKLYINTINPKRFKEVIGTIEIRDHKRDKKIKIASSHELFGVNDPKNGDHSVRIVSRIFGYRPKEHVINLNQPVNDSTSSYVQTIGDSIIVNLDLERLGRGEIAVMWNVLFFKDAAIMRPDSKDELSSLLAMLKENEKSKVRIHGHTNGNSHGKLLHLNLEDKDFFSLSGNHMEDVGSARKLSEYRAYTIQHYLMDQGIDESRLEIKGWGGKKMMFDKHDEQARKNVRVEIEITDI